MTQTTGNLKAAFAGESQANRKYLAFAKKADEEGFPQIAKLFRAAAESETVHAHAHLRVLNGVKSTAENLAEAVNGETFEFTNMYPQFIEEAKAEGNTSALISFNNANKVEQVHADLYKTAIESINNKQDLPNADIHVCPICGDTFTGETPDKCPICGVAKEKFLKIA
ncbi:MAG: rubrerythrin family protein [Candidatus Bathyarchaeota archaeon]|nr:rubrerythrin family protein [Candidatus Termiticorpusculum sp.]